ncbi:unnamed protein product [Nippostrongylus brasiliensis]|uniref:Secreted protein n=1 Tax=Nippostrongylus brasiliensis TaxID=27835 RepID=A0A0N4YG18_NIPBR|nr:hypothetical protein Q1695_001634 [Nippostrongylus brasiliensis]VDL79326.1 unnamed protein product [Nippostrongylus brasiliensis]
MTTFTVLFILALCVSGFLQAYFFEVIYSFYSFLSDRESSFNFNFEETSATRLPSTTSTPDVINDTAARPQ